MPAQSPSKNNKRKSKRTKLPPSRPARGYRSAVENSLSSNLDPHPPPKPLPSRRRPQAKALVPVSTEVHALRSSPEPLEASRVLPRVKFYGALKEHIQHKRAPGFAADAMAAYYECCSQIGLLSEQKGQQSKEEGQDQQVVGGAVHLQDYGMGNEKAFALASRLQMIELPIASFNLASNRLNR